MGAAIKRYGFGNPHFWTDEEISRLRDLYPDTSNRKLASLFGRSETSINAAGSSFGLKKSGSYLRTIGIQKGSVIGSAHRFGKGHMPANKGLRRSGYHRGRMSQTQFPAGGRPVNWKPIGTVMQDRLGYQRIKVREPEKGEGTGTANRLSWPFLHVHLWEKAHGPVPPGHVIAFANGDRSCCDVANLECISRAELARRNAMWGRLPDDLIAAITANGALKRRITIHGKKQNN